MLFLCYPNCSTCAKARNYLQGHGLDFSERDIKVENPSMEELHRWHEQSGLPLRRFFNTSGLQYRSLGLKDKLAGMSETEQLALLSSDGMLVKRPLLIGEGFVLVGFRQEEWDRSLLKN